MCFFGTDVESFAGIDVDVLVRVQIDLALAAYVHGVGAVHIHGAFAAHLDPALPVGMYKIKAVGLVGHGDLMALGCAYPYEVVAAPEITVVHDDAVSAPASLYPDVFELYLPGIEFFLDVGLAKTALVYGASRCADAKHRAGTLALCAAADGTADVVGQESLVGQDREHIAVNRFDLIEESRIFRDGWVFLIDLDYGQLASPGEISLCFLICVLCIKAPAGAYGRDHVRDTGIGHATQIVALVGIAGHEKAYHLHTYVGRGEPHAVALLVAFVAAGTRAARGVVARCDTVKRRDVAHRAPQCLVVGIAARKLLDIDLQASRTGGIDVVAHHTDKRTKIGWLSTTIEFVVTGASAIALYIIRH